MHERLQKLAAEELGERLHREQKAAARVNPVSIVMQRTGGHEAMQMQVLRERLAPGVQDQGRGDLAAEPARIGTELDECCRDASEEQAVDDARIALRERVQLVR